LKISSSPKSGTTRKNKENNTIKKINLKLQRCGKFCEKATA
jgi:hypothetical protein